MFLSKYIDNVFINLIDKEPDPLDKARIRMLGYILLFYSVFTGILIIPYYLLDLDVHLIRVSVIFVASFVLIGFARHTYMWRPVSHTILILITLGVWSNLSIYVRNVNLETLQYIWFACVLSFYIHGSKFGWIYSALNILPVVAFTIADNKDYFYIGSTSHEVTHSIYIFVTAYNFLLIIFLQSYFFRSFTNNIKRLQEVKADLGMMNTKLNQTLSEVEKLSNSRMDFLSTMSHEIRTPLNGVIGLTNVLLIENPRKDQAENLDMLKFSAENLLLLVNNVLDVNKLDSTKSEVEKIGFDLAELITRVYSSSKLPATEKMLEFNLVIDPDLVGKVVISDPTRITQVLLNLIYNAIKFTEAGRILLSARCVDLCKSKVKVQFTIEDTGIGICADKLDSIFEPFMQASTSTNRNYGGTGLGLPIVKKTLDLLHSEIMVESEENKGTTFVFEIDFDYTESNDKNAIVNCSNDYDLSGLKVLIAEDNSINRMVIDKILKKWNITPIMANDGLCALKCLEAEDFDVVLMDLHMPVMDGYESATLIRNLQDPRKANIHIIALTASANENVAKNVSDAKMNDYLSKPFNPEHLFTKLKEIRTTYEV